MSCTVSFQESSTSQAWSPALLSFSLFFPIPPKSCCTANALCLLCFPIRVTKYMPKRERRLCNFKDKAAEMTRETRTKRISWRFSFGSLLKSFCISFPLVLYVNLMWTLLYGGIQKVECVIQYYILYMYHRFSDKIKRCHNIIIWFFLKLYSSLVGFEHRIPGRGRESKCTLKLSNHWLLMLSNHHPLIHSWCILDQYAKR